MTLPGDELEDLDPLRPAELERLGDHDLLIVMAVEMRHARRHTRDQNVLLTEQNGRIGRLEKWQLRVIAAGSTVTAAAMALLAVLALPGVREAIGQALAGG